MRSARHATRQLLCLVRGFSRERTTTFGFRTVSEQEKAQEGTKWTRRAAKQAIVGGLVPSFSPFLCGLRSAGRVYKRCQELRCHERYDVVRLPSAVEGPPGEEIEPHPWITPPGRGRWDRYVCSTLHNRVRVTVNRWYEIESERHNLVLWWHVLLLLQWKFLVKCLKVSKTVKVSWTFFVQSTSHGNNSHISVLLIFLSRRCGLSSAGHLQWLWNNCTRCQPRDVGTRAEASQLPQWEQKHPISWWYTTARLYKVQVINYKPFPLGV